MVLSHKKLKQKLRSLVAESLAAPGREDLREDAASEEINQQLQSIKELLGSKSRRPKSSKRPRRAKKRPLSEEEETQKGIGENDGLIGFGEDGKSGKRKRDRELDGVKESKEKKKQKKNKKKKKEEKAETGAKKNESEDKGGSNDKEVVESNQFINTAESEQNVKKVYVGGIPYYSTEDDIRSFFDGCGTVTEIDCMTFPESGKFRGIAILTFKTESAAKRALDLDGADMGGFYLKIQLYKATRAQKSDFAPQVMEGYNRIYVGNLSWDVTEDDLKKLFSDCKISSIRFGTDKETGDFKGYAHIDFSDSMSLTIALKLDQKVVCGRPVRIRCAVPKKEVDNKSVLKTTKMKAGNETENRSVLQTSKTNSGNGPENKAVLKTNDKKDSDGANSGQGKKKRRTCYECGTPGHLSSSCPSKMAVKPDNSGIES
ncbi:phragmoplastin interacting protein 1 [Typha latifolia]|uniref:phragmoplastin interacting protein 1 n=1 Tax=Typha latifolia TaxID=4733 RepID=UPI003C2D643B